MTAPEQARRALWLGAERHSVDGDDRANPAGIFEQSIAELFATLMRIVCGRGVVMIDATAAVLMGLPTGTMPYGPDAKDHAVAVQLRAAGFTIKEIGRWFHVQHREIFGEGVWFGLPEFADVDYCPIIGETPALTTYAMAAWDRITGQVWRGSAADAGNAMLREQRYSKTRGGKPVRPVWWSWEGPEGDPIELPYMRSTWSRPAYAPTLYGYDRVRAYLSAMTCTDIAAEPLTHDGLTTFDKKRAGWWLCHLRPWEFTQCLPDPAGYSGDGLMVRWLTSPTVALLTDLAADGFYQFEIMDSWTAPGTPVMKTYGAELRRTWDEAGQITDPAVRDLVRQGTKAAFRMGHGYWRSKQSTVQLPAAASAVTAMSRSNTFRRLFDLWAGPERKFDGPYPTWIDTDAVWFEQEVAPDGWTIWDGTRDDLDEVTKLGHWRTCGTRARKANVSRETAVAA